MNEVNLNIKGYHLFSSEMLTDNFINAVSNLTTYNSRLSGYFPFSKEIGTFIKVNLRRDARFEQCDLTKSEIHKRVTELFSYIHGVYEVPMTYDGSIIKETCRTDYKKILCLLEKVTLPFNFLGEDYYKEVYAKYDFISIDFIQRPIQTIVMNRLLRKYEPYKFGSFNRIALDGPHDYED